MVRLSKVVSFSLGVPPVESTSPRSAESGAPVTAAGQVPKIVAHGLGDGGGIHFRQMAFAIQPVDGGVVQFQRRPIFDFRPQQPVGQGNPVHAAALAAVQAKAFPPQPFVDLHVNGGGPGKPSRPNRNAPISKAGK